MLDALLPAPQRLPGIATAVQFHIAMQAHVYEVGGNVLDARPFPGAVGYHQRYPVLAQQLDEGFAQETFVANFHRMAQPGIAADVEAAIVLQACRAALGAFAGSLAVARQQVEEPGKAAFIELHVRRKLPQERPELVAQQQRPGGKKVGHRLFDVLQPSHMGDIARPLDCEHEAVRRLVTPAQVTLGRLQAVERAIDLDAGDRPRGERQFVVLG
ncbi:hypothetical protein D3C76_1027920 [compost metagenome]